MFLLKPGNFPGWVRDRGLGSSVRVLSESPYSKSIRQCTFEKCKKGKVWGPERLWVRIFSCEGSRVERFCGRDFRLRREHG